LHQYSFTKKNQSQTVIREKLQKALLYKKGKSNVVVEIDNRCQFHLRSKCSFYAHRSRKQKKTAKLSVFFALLGSSSVKAACRTLMKFTPKVNFTNMFTRSFYAYRSQKHKKTDNLTAFLCFWTLHAQKLHVKCWLNWRLVKCWWNWLQKSEPNRPLSLVHCCCHLHYVLHYTCSCQSTPVSGLRFNSFC